MRRAVPGSSALLPVGVAAPGWWCVVAALASVYVYMAVALPGGPYGMSDLLIYRGAVQTLLAGGSLYDFTSFAGAGFTYPPFAGLLFTPFALVPGLWLRVIWTLLQCVEVTLLAWVVASQMPRPAFISVRRRVLVPCLTALLMLTQPVFTGLFLGQVSLLITLLVLLDALDLTPRRLQGIPTGVAAAIKLTPLALLPFLWLTGRRRAAVAGLAAFVGFTGAAWLVLPADSRAYWPSVLSAPGFVNLAQGDNQSIQGFLARVGWEEPLRSTVLICLLVTVGVLGYLRSRQAYLEGQRLASAVIVGAMVVLVSPISWSHHQTLLVVAAACTVSAASHTVNRIWSFLVLLLGTVPFSLVLSRVWPAGRLLTDNVVFVLALLIVCVMPFRSSSSARSAARGARLEGAGTPRDTYSASGLR